MPFLPPNQQRQSTEELVQQHVDYVTRKFGYRVVVVFDGYNNALSTKDHEHRRRQQRIHKVVPVVDVATSQVLGFDQDTFLASGQNKDSFILLLLVAFSTVGIKSLQAPGDADTVIVSEAYCMHPLQIAEVSQFLQTIQIFWPCYSTTQHEICLLFTFCRKERKQHQINVFTFNLCKQNSVRACANRYSYCMHLVAQT